MHYQILEGTNASVAPNLKGYDAIIKNEMEGRIVFITYSHAHVLYYVTMMSNLVTIFNIFTPITS